MGRLQTLLIKASGLISTAALLFLLLLVSWGVFSRYILRTPSLVALEISGYMMVLLAFLPAGYLAYKNQHVASEFLVSRVSNRGKLILKVVSNIVVGFYSIIILYEGIKTVSVMYQGDFRSTTLLNFPTWIVYLLIPLGSFFLILPVLSNIIKLLSEYKNREL